MSLTRISYLHSYTREDETGPFQETWQTPITDEHLLTVNFKQIGEFDRVNQFEGNGLKQTYAKLINLVMQSVKIELSESIRSEQAAVKTAYPDESFAEHLPPYEYELFKPRDKLDVIRQVSADSNHDFSIPDEVFDKQVDCIMAVEKGKSEAAYKH